MNEIITVLVGAAGPTGGLLWFMYYTISKTIPDIVAGHRAEMKGLAETHRTEMKGIAESHRMELNSLVTAFRSDLTEERQLRETLLRDVIERAKFACPNAPINRINGLV